MNPLARTMVLWQGPGRGDRTLAGQAGLGCLFRFKPVAPSSSQVLPVHAQVRPVRSGPQGDAYRFPLHHPHQDQVLTEEVSSQEEPERVLHELAQLRQLLIQWQTQPSRTGEPRFAPPHTISSGCFCHLHKKSPKKTTFPAGGDISSLCP